MTTPEKPPRMFLVWADVSRREELIELPGTATDKECEDACKDALEVLISNGDTGWNEIHPDGSES